MVPGTATRPKIPWVGMMQDPALNEVLYTYCTDTTDGRNWNVRVN